MPNTITCPWCGDDFTPDHGNDTYCGDDCKYDAKRDRQKTKRDPISRFIPILMANHEAIHYLSDMGKLELSRSEVDAYTIDISLSRHMQPPGEHAGKLMLDFGEYFLITDLNFLTFKIFKHDTTNAAKSE